MSPSFLIKILRYTWRPFAVSLASSAFICAARCLILKSSTSTDICRLCQSDGERPPCVGPNSSF